MSLTTIPIPNLIDGVTQQPAIIALPSQARVLENAKPSPARGLMRRPGTRFIAKVPETADQPLTPVVLERDAAEQYQLLIGDGWIKVFDFDGNEKTVNAPQGFSYLSCSGGRYGADRAFSTVTRADTTFIANRNVVTQMSGAKSPSYKPQGLVWVRQGAYAATYKVVVKGTSFELTTPDGSDVSHAPQIETDQIMYDLQQGLGSVAGVACYRSGSALVVESDDGSDFQMNATDSQGNSLIKAYKKEVSSYGQLPAECRDGFKIKVVPGGGETGYWVQYQSASAGLPASHGEWREIVAPDQETTFDASTMPHVLRRESNGTFTFEPATWNERLAGDEDTNPRPSFIGYAINDIFIHRDRLGFLADENYILSRSRDYFNFWRDTAQQLLDDDPIDAAVGQERVSVLRHAVEYNRALLFFSEFAQFSTAPNQILSPRNPAGLASKTTEFRASLGAKPAGVGSFVFFVDENTDFASVLEFYITSDNQTNDANEVTGHVPNYIPSGVHRIIASPSQKLLLVLTEGDPQAAYVYSWVYKTGEKALSSWNRWDFGDGATIHGGGFIGSRLYLVIGRPDGLYLDYMELETPEDGKLRERLVCLDSFVKDLLVPDYGEAQNKTWVGFPYQDEDSDRLVVLASENHPNYPVGHVFSFDRSPNGRVIVDGNHPAGSLIIGRRYRFWYVFPTLLIRSEATGGGVLGITQGTTRINYLSLNYNATGYFRVRVSPKGRDPWEQVFSGWAVGDVDEPLGDVSLTSGLFAVAVGGRNDLVDVEIINDSPYPCRFLSGEWEAQYTTRARRGR